MIGAATPIVATVGVIAMRKEQAAITVTDTVNAKRRPCRSAKRPKYQAPIGRIRKVIAKIAHTYSVALGSPGRKNFDSKYTANTE